MVGMGKTGIAGLALAGLTFAVTALACNESVEPAPPRKTPGASSGGGGSSSSSSGSLGSSSGEPVGSVGPGAVQCAALPDCSKALAAPRELVQPNFRIESFGDESVVGRLASSDWPATMIVGQPSPIYTGPTATPGYRVVGELGSTRFLVCPAGAPSCEVWTRNIEPDSAAPAAPFAVTRAVGDACAAKRGVACLVGNAWTVALDPSAAPADVRSYQRPDNTSRGLAVFEDDTAAWVEPDGRLTPIVLPGGAKVRGARLAREGDGPSAEKRLAGITTDGRVIVGDLSSVTVCGTAEALVGFGTLGDPLAWRADGTSYLLFSGATAVCGPRFSAEPTLARGSSCRHCGTIIATAMAVIGTGGEGLAPMCRMPCDP